MSQCTCTDGRRTVEIYQQCHPDHTADSVPDYTQPPHRLTQTDFHTVYTIPLTKTNK